MKKIFKSSALIFIIICIGAAATFTLWLPIPAKFLIVADNAGNTDAAIVLSGDWNFGRESKAVELYKRGHVKKIIRILEKEDAGFFKQIKKLYNLDLSQKDAYTRYFESAGVPRKTVLLGEMLATSTFDEVIAARKLALADNMKSVTVVTSNYHMRRALLTVKWVFRHDNIAVYNASFYDEDIHPDRWWLHESDIKSVIMEYLSLLLYLCYHFTTGK